MGKRTNSAKWSPSEERWRIAVQKDGQRKVFTSGTPGRTGQREANAKADAWLDADVVAGARVSALWDKYLQGKRETTSEDTSNKIEYYGRCYVLPCIGHMKIENVTEGQLQAIIDKAYKVGSLAKSAQRKPRNGEPLSRKTLQGLKAEIVAFVKFCRVKERATSLVPESLTVPKSARLKGKDVLQPEALAVLLTCDTTVLRGKRVFDDYIYAYRFQVLTGLRPGELVGLTYGDISPTGEVRIKRSINSHNNETQGKNENAIRSFMLTEQAKSAYDAQIALLKSYGVRLNFNTSLFRIDNQHSYYGRWTRYLHENGLPHVSPYELRHTFVSIAKYLPSGEVKPLVGHSRAMDTFGQYGHFITGDAERAASDLSKVFNTIITTKKCEQKCEHLEIETPENA